MITFEPDAEFEMKLRTMYVPLRRAVETGGKRLYILTFTVRPFVLRLLDLPSRVENLYIRVANDRLCAAVDFVFFIAVVISPSSSP